MAGSLQALDILVAPSELDLAAPSLVVLHGEEQFLTLAMLDLLRARLCPDEADWAWAWREFDGSAELDPREVFDEAATIPMFGTASRTAVVRQADAYVTAARDRLEAIATAARGRRGLVILAVKSFPSNTRLAKAVAKQGLAIETSISPKADLARWIRTWAQARHGLKLAPATAQRLLERLGGQLGQIDQALARLASATDPRAKVTTIEPDAIDDFAGSPQERTAWGMIDAAAGGPRTWRPDRFRRKPGRHRRADRVGAPAALDRRPPPRPAGKRGPARGRGAGASRGGRGRMAQGARPGEGIAPAAGPAPRATAAGVAPRPRPRAQGGGFPGTAREAGVGAALLQDDPR